MQVRVQKILFAEIFMKFNNNQLFGQYLRKGKKRFSTPSKVIATI